MNIHQVLQDNNSKLLNQYEANFQTVRDLQNIFQNDILPSLVNELALDEDSTQFARDWLNDTGKSPFHLASETNEYSDS